MIGHENDTALKQSSGLRIKNSINFQNFKPVLVSDTILGVALVTQKTFKQQKKIKGTRISLT